MKISIKLFSISCLAVFLIVSSQLFSQENKKLIFLDAMYGNPISDVEVYNKSKFITKTDKNGQCFVPQNAKTIYCLHTGYTDTLINLAYQIGDEIMLNPRYKILDEVEIRGRYRAKKHFKRLIEQSRETVQDLDTIFYYLIHDKMIYPSDTLMKIDMTMLQKTVYSNKTNQVHDIMESLMSYSESLNYKGPMGRRYISSNPIYKEKLFFSRPSILYSVKRGEKFGGDTIQFILKVRDLFGYSINAYYFISGKLRSIESSREFTNKGTNYQTNFKTLFSCSPYVVMESIYSQTYTIPKSKLSRKNESLNSRVFRYRKERVPKPKQIVGVDASSVYSSYDAIRLGRKVFLGKDAEEESLSIDVDISFDVLDTLDLENISIDIENLIEEYEQ